MRRRTGPFSEDGNGGGKNGVLKHRKGGVQGSAFLKSE